MTVEQVFQLLDKGFSRDDIMQLVTEPAQENQEQKEPQEPQEPQEPKEPQEPQKEPEAAKPAAAPEPAETEKRLDSIEASISKLVKAIQNQNLLHDSLKRVPESIEAETDKIMASIIRPETDKHNKE